MHTRLLSLLSRRLLLPVLLVGLSLGGVSLALFEHPLSANAASHPSYVLVVGGQKYIAQYEGGAYNSDVTSHSIYTDFGRWNEYTVDSHGKRHLYGQFSGNENTYVNGHGQLQTGVNVNVPGVGHINTYPHEDVFNPHLTPPPHGYFGPPENYFGERLSGVASPAQPIDCEVDASNVDNGHFGSGTRQLFGSGEHRSQQLKDCEQGDYDFSVGDKGIGGIFRHLARSPRANGSMFASLLQPQLPVPVILNLAGGIFFIGAIATGNICTFVSCGTTTKKVLAAISIGFAIMSVASGQFAVNATAMRAFASEGSAALSAIASEAAGAVEITGAVSPGLAARAASEAVTISDLSARSSISVLP